MMMRSRVWISLLTVLMMAAGALVLPSVGADAGARGSTPNTDSEPNGDFANATLVVPGGGNTIKIKGTADGNDALDFYKIRLNFTAPNTAEKLNVTTDVNTDMAAVRVFLYDTNAKFMVLDADANPSQKDRKSVV